MSELLEAAANGELPAEPEVLRQAIATHGAAAPLTVLHKVIERVRAREAAVAADETRGLARGACRHASRARRAGQPPRGVRPPRDGGGAGVEQTPVGMLSALQQVGDASVLDAVADAWAGSSNAWFRGQLVTIFRAVVAREKITRAARRREEAGDALPEPSRLWGRTAALWVRSHVGRAHLRDGRLAQ